jgi:hypothetical protein
MAVDHCRPGDFAQNSGRNWIGTLASNEPGIRDNAELEVADTFFPSSLAECHKSSRNHLGHVTRQLVNVPLSAADDAIFGVEQRGYEVKDRTRDP